IRRLQRGGSGQIAKNCRVTGRSTGPRRAKSRRVSMAVVLITGCSSGIGLATARHFARLGDEVHAGVRNISTAAELTAAIENEHLKISPLTLDVDDEGSVRPGVQEVIARSGRIDVLVNNAGIGGGGPIEDVPLEFAKAMFETNYFGAL